MAIGDKDRCVGCAMGAHPHDQAACPHAGCRCNWREPRQVATDPADLTDSELLYELAAALRIYALGAHPRIPALVDVARDRAAMFLRLT